VGLKGNDIVYHSSPYFEEKFGSPAKPCVYPKIMDRRNRKKFTSMTPLS
jgi:hypothetical protein